MIYRFVFEPRSEQPIRAAFLDRDGVINVDYAYVHSQETFHFVPGALSGASALVKKGFCPVVVTNQSGIGRGKYSLNEFRDLCFWLAGVFSGQGAPLCAIYYCPHHPEHAFAPFLKDCSCRKPKPGLILQAAEDLNIDLSASILVGDKASDIQAAHAAGVGQAVLVRSDGTRDLAPCALPHLSADNLLEASRLI